MKMDPIGVKIRYETSAAWNRAANWMLGVGLVGLVFGAGYWLARFTE